MCVIGFASSFLDSSSSSLGVIAAFLIKFHISASLSLSKMFELEFEPVYVLLVGFFVVGVALIFFGKKKDDGSVGVPTTSDASDSIV